MAAVTEGTQAPDPAAESRRLGEEIERAQAEMQHAVQIAGLKGDPMLPVLQALTDGLSLQWRLHDSAIRNQRDTSDRLDRQAENAISRTGKAMEAHRSEIIASLAPELARLAATNARVWNRNLTAKTALGIGAFTVVIALAVGWKGYDLGWQAGRILALNTSATLTAAAQEGSPDTQAALAQMIRSNNLPSAWAACLHSASFDKSGRKVCAMPMWAEPPHLPTRG